MFENMNPLDRPTAFFEIAVLLLISFIIGFLAARLPISGSIPIKKNKRFKKSPNIIDDEYVDPRDIITEPTSIKAVLTRDRKGNPIAPMKTGHKKSEPSPANAPTKIAAIKKDYSSKAVNNKPKSTTKKDNPTDSSKKD